MRNLLKWTLFALPILVLSCSKNEDKTLDGDKIPVALSAGIKTRAVDTSWVNGDCIGLTSFKTGTNSPLNKMHNCRYSTGGDGYFDADDQNRIYYPLDGSEVDLLGYYPYQEGLMEDHVYDIDVTNQSSLPKIDLMTFSRHVGASKNKPNVTVTFKHKLTKLLFNITQEDVTKSLKIKGLSINGMHTTGDFNIFEEECIKHTGSKQSIEVPVTGANTAKAIVLPHDAGEGVSFSITLEDGTLYSIALDQTQELKTGAKYTFNILLRDKETPTTIKGVIQDWEDGGEFELYGTAFIAEQNPGQTINFQAGDEVTLYCETQELTTFTYNGGKWIPASPVYWENIGDGVSETVNLRAKFVRTIALDDTQLPEVLLAETTVNRFEGVSFNFKLVPTKVVFQLKSETTDANGRFSQDELDNAVIQLPDFINEYTMDYGVFTKGVGIGNIQVVDKTALLIPQSRDGEFAIITISGHKYRVSLKESMNLEAGKVYTFIVNIIRTEVSSFTISYTDWVFGEDVDVTATPIALQQTPGSTVGNFKVNDEITVYYENTELTTFKYNGTDWNTDTPIYWENIGDGSSEKVFLHATYIRTPKSDNSQLDEFMLAKGEIDRFTGLNFSFELAPSKVVFELSSDGSFTKEQLETASIHLLDLTTDYTLDRGTFTPGTTKGNVNVVDYTALVVPQSKSGKLANIVLNGNTYQITLPNPVTFEAGLSHKISVSINKSHISLSSVSYTDWTTGGGIITTATPVNLQVSAGTTENFTPGNQITLYSGTTKLATYTYTSDSWSPDVPVYWENIGDGSTTVPIKAIFAREAALHSTQLPEVFLASTTATRFQGITLKFELVPAKVVFNLTSISSIESEKFTAEQLNNATIQLPGYVTGYTLDNAEYVVQNSTTGTITTVGKKALIIPQAKSGTLAEVSIGDNKYVVNSIGAISFEAGYVTKLTVNILKTQAASISASYTDWEDDNVENKFTAFIFSGTGTTTMFKANDTFSLYYDKTGEAGKKVGDFVYNGTGAWNSTPPMYWEDLEQKDAYDFYATCILNEPLGNNQMADVMYAKASGVSRFGAMTLDFTKRTSRVIIKLKSSNASFSDAELAGAGIYLPDYKVGATYNGANFQTGATKGTITTKKTDGELIWVALIESQTIVSGNNLIKITIGSNDYFVKASTNVDFDIAKTHTYSIDMKKGEISFSTGYTDWEPGDDPEDINVELD